MRSSKTPIRTVACVIGLGLMFVQAAFAGEKQPIRFNAADQAAAKAVTLKAADLGPGWKGGAKKPDLHDRSRLHVQALRPRSHRRREVRVQAGGRGASLTSESNVLQTPAMVGAPNGAGASETAATWRAHERS